MVLRMVALRDNVRQRKVSSLTYPSWLRARLKQTNEKISSQELAKEYEIETGKRISRQSAANALRNIDFGSIKRREKLYWSPYEKKEGKKYCTGPKEASSPIHSSHNYRFSTTYKGSQPLDGKILAFGNPRAKVRQVQVWFEFRQPNELKRIIAFKNRLVVMLANPKGETTQEQVIEARSLAFKAIKAFANERKLELGPEFDKLINSHHVLELGNAQSPRTSTNLNGYIKDAITGMEKEIFENVGSRFDGSHPGRFEHENISRNYSCTPEQRAKNTEWLLARFREDFGLLCALNADYAKNHASHLRLIANIDKTLEELRDAIRKMGDKKC